jgi:hypothetical protein
MDTDFIVPENKNVIATLNKVYGSSTGKFIYAVIIINEGDLAETQAKFYCGDTEDEIGNILEEEGYTDMDFILSKCGVRELTLADL